MNSELPPVSAPPVTGPAASPTAPPPVKTGGGGSPTPSAAPGSKPASKRNWLLLGCGGLIALLLVVILSVVITIWWINRPIKPVVLSEKEKQTVEAKLNYIQDASAGKRPTVESLSDDKPKPEPDRIYIPGSKELRLTEREINGLLNENTDLGKSVRLEFGRDAINAYVATPIPEDVPLVGGKMFRARGRFKLSIGNGGEPFAILEDVTVFGLSLPKAWLGDIKGENLLSESVRSSNGKPVLRGVKSLRVEPGAIVIKVED